MKTIFTLIASLIFCTISFSQTRPINKVTTWYGNWSSANNWSLKRVPADGDSIIVDGGRGILLDKNYNLKNVYIRVVDNGSYIHVNAKLNLDDASFIQIGERARIMAFGANRKNETISIGGVKKFDENANSNVYGFAAASKHTGASPNGFISDMNLALPVTFLSFIASKTTDGVVLNWSTASEKDNSHFEVEKSFDGRNWKSIAVFFGNGTVNSGSNYSFKDKESASLIYYRIRQVDMDGKATYTSVRTIMNGQVGSARIYTAQSKTITIDLNKENSSAIKLTVVNMGGQVVASRTYINPSNSFTLSLPGLSGMYIVHLQDQKGLSQAQKLVL